MVHLVYMLNFYDAWAVTKSASTRLTGDSFNRKLFSCPCSWKKTTPFGNYLPDT